MERVVYGGYIIWSRVYHDYSICDVEMPGYAYPVHTCETLSDAKAWVDENPDGHAVVERLIEERDARIRDMIVDILCG